MRWLRLLTIAAAVIVFLLLSGLLARAFSIDGAEQSAITRVVQAEARGDSGGMIKLIQHCVNSPFCRSRARADAGALRRAGRVSILELNPSAGFSLVSTLGVARVAWRAGSSLPVVQCVRVRRAGNVISGLSVQLLEISRRINTGANCPNQF
ncbi:MAG TPA: hypothetical protein VE983_04275 [Solirubrobacteraceae bacterium]|nr:hypothetical protein [Solirubrobacteraceae bacterium]